jgi:hypothetical protein
MFFIVSGKRIGEIMKKLGILALLFMMTIAIYSQDDTEKKQIDRKNIKTLESKQDFTEEIIIKKPDNSSLMTRKETDATVDMKIDIKEKIKKSNKLLY